MNENATLRDIQHVIGYEFQDPEILEAALTRRAFLNENPSDHENFMDPLATLGDAILAAVVVYKSYDDGNKQDKASLTTEKVLKGNRKNTRIVAEKYQLQKYVHWGKGEKQDECWNKGETALDAVFEALIGGVFLDSQRNKKNGMTEVEKMLDRLEFF